MAAAQILSPLSPHVLSPFASTFDRQTTFLDDFGSVFPSPSAFQAEFRRKDTILMTELPHVAAYADHDVQKDLPHQKTRDGKPHLRNKDTKAVTTFESLVLDASNVDATLAASPTALIDLVTLIQNSWKVNAWTTKALEKLWMSSDKQSPTTEDVSDEYVLLNLGITYQVGRHGVVAESLTALTITDDAWEAIVSTLYSRPLTLDYDTAIPQYIPSVRSDVLLGSMRALRNQVLHQPFLRDGETETRSMTSLVPTWEAQPLRGVVWWLPSLKSSDEEKVLVSVEVVELDDNDEDDWVTVDDDARDDATEVAEPEEEVSEHNACFVTSDNPLIEAFVRDIKAVL